MFRLIAAKGQARLGELTTTHGVIQTPCFMPIATRGSVKFLRNNDFAAIGNQILLANAYHLYLRPGLETLRTIGGLHALMNWSKPILTDSGGFQVFSLAHLRKLTDDGVKFQSHLDGRECFFTPELSMEIQATIGSDIWMCFDYFPGYPASFSDAQAAVTTTTKWAQRCSMWHSNYVQHSALGQQLKPQLFAIVQGSSFSELRQTSAAALTAQNFDGYAIGGLAVGEPVEVMYQMLDVTMPLLPANKPRYLMGVGQPEQMLEAVKRGVDMFDCVLPTRNARHGQMYVRTAEQLVGPELDRVNYRRFNITSAQFSSDTSVLDPWCQCSTCSAGYSKAYLRHLLTIGEPLGLALATVHNVTLYVELMRQIRQHLQTV